MFFTKQAPAPGESLRREAELLKQVAHPNVVRAHSFTVEGGTATLELVRCQGRSLLEALPDEAADLKDTFATIAATVAHLHSKGVAHGAITADHVLVTPAGRPVLCGFGQARMVETDDAMFANDVMAIGSLMQSALSTRATDTTELDAVARRAGLGALDARSLCDVLRSGRSRPTKTQLPRGRHFAESTKPRSTPASLFALRNKQPPRPKSWRGPVAVTACLLAGITVLAVVAFPADEPRPQAAVTDSSCADGSTNCVTPTEPVVFAHEGQRYAVGQQGDTLLVGAWDCGPRTPVLLQRSSGAVYAFDGLATNANLGHGRLLSNEQRFKKIDSVVRPSGCEVLVGMNTEGKTLNIETSR